MFMFKWKKKVEIIRYNNNIYRNDTMTKQKFYSPRKH